MTFDLTAPAQVMWHLDEEDPPDDWDDAIAFPTLSEALAAIFGGTPQTGHPWVLCRRRVFSPREAEALWLGRDDP